MAKGSFRLRWHGNGTTSVPYDYSMAGYPEAPDMYCDISYNIRRDSSNRNSVIADVTATLCPTSYDNGYFGYSIDCYAGFVGGSNHSLFSKPSSVMTWNWEYSGSIRATTVNSTTRTAELRIYFDSNCPCNVKNGSAYYSIIVDIGYAYSTPNLIITSINGVSILEGENNYNIAINGNQDITVGYSGWNGSTSVDTCKINAWLKPYDRTKSNLSWKTILNDGNGRSAGSQKYKKYNNSNDPATPIGSGAPFSYDNQYVWIYAEREHNGSKTKSAQKLHSNIRLMKILYTPIKQVLFTKQPIGLYESRSNIQISWNYPNSPSLIQQYGIVSGYEIRLINKDTGKVELIDTTTGISYTLASDSYKPLTKYYLQVIPYYLNGSSRSYGPSNNSKDFMLITKLDPPTIDYPKTEENCVWIGNKLYILGQLPYDPDSVGLPNYTYKDLEVNINGTTYKFSTHSNMFSISNLGHNLKFVFTTKNINIPFSNTYIIKTRVQKNFTFDGNYYKWSEYTTKSLKSVEVPSVPKFSGYVLASQYSPIYKYVMNMRNCYIEDNDIVLVKNLIRGDYINRSDFQNAYNDLYGISQIIDHWGEYSKDMKVKFNGYNKFNPKIEYITDIDSDTNPTGNNYFIQSYNWIRFYG